MKKISTTLPIRFIHSLLDGISLDTEQCIAYLQRVGISPSLLDDNFARVTADQFAGFYRLLANELDDETPGFFSRPLRRGTFKFLCLSLLDSSNLDAALYRLTQFFRIVLDDLIFELKRNGNLVCVTLVPKTEEVRCNHFSQEMMLKLVHGLTSWLAGRKLPLARVDVTYARPEHVSEYVFLYPGPIYFDQRVTALYFEKSALQIAIRQSKHSLHEFLARAPADWMFYLFAEKIVSHRVRGFLENRLNQPKTIQEVAEALNLSVRTLSRRLSDEGTTFQVIKSDLRRDVAIQKLIKTKIPVALIGNQVGFDDTAAFHRAFKKWTGSTPRTYRYGIK